MQCEKRWLIEIKVASDNLITKSVFTRQELDSKKRPDTAASQFKSSLGLLVEILMKKEPSYIRCIKPNDTKSPDQFDTAIVAHQVSWFFSRLSMFNLVFIPFSVFKNWPKTLP